MVLVYEDVLRLEVSVGVAGLVDVGDPGHDLPEELPALGLAEPVPVHDVVEQLSPWAVLQHLAQVRWSVVLSVLSRSYKSHHINLSLVLQHL